MILTILMLKFVQISISRMSADYVFKLLSIKGGLGKTTAAIRMVQIYSEHGEDTLLIDASKSSDAWHVLFGDKEGVFGEVKRRTFRDVVYYVLRLYPNPFEKPIDPTPYFNERHWKYVIIDGQTGAEPDEPVYRLCGKVNVNMYFGELTSLSHALKYAQKWEEHKCNGYNKKALIVNFVREEYWTETKMYVKHVAGKMFEPISEIFYVFYDDDVRKSDPREARGIDRAFSLIPLPTQLDLLPMESNDNKNYENK